MKEALVAIHLEELPEGGFLATSEELPGLVAQGRTLAETLEIAQDVARKLVESYIEHGDELPLSLKEIPDSGLELRIPVNIG
ncbi:MAG: type II toxin-antitoxin system HicB family antitoxin [Chloroflexi bacterium]|nr:type II toxin-antitoxin system HicB family antitoxin [Chloroflexota bacterium]